MLLVTIFQLTKFVPQKHVDLITHRFGRSRDTKPTLSCDTPALDGRAADHIMLQPSRLCEYTSNRIFVCFSSMRSKPPRSTSQMACANLKTLTSQMLIVPMASPVGHGIYWCGSDGAMCM